METEEEIRIGGLNEEAESILSFVLTGNAMTFKKAREEGYLYKVVGDALEQRTGDRWFMPNNKPNPYMEWENNRISELKGGKKIRIG